MRKKKSKVKATTRPMQVYPKDHETFSQLASQTNRSHILMFRHLMDCVRKGEPIAFTLAPHSDNGKAATK